MGQRAAGAVAAEVAKHDAGAPALIQTRGLGRSFAGVPALAEVDFSMRAGEIHALVGANGAGKSTLIKLLSGVYRPSSGQILVDGRPVVFDSPRRAQLAGIATVYQELSLVPQLTVAENLFLGREPRCAGVWIDRGRRRAEAITLLQSHGFVLEPDIPVGALGLADQQLVEIARALSLRSRMLILDEPTAVLSIREQDKLFAIVRALRARGIAILYISHRLEEVFALAERVSVFRDGRLRTTVPVSDTNEAEIVRHMVGELTAAPPTDTARGSFPALLEARWHYGGQDNRLTVGSGEIVGIAGFVGAGRSRVARRIAGAGADAMEIHLQGRPVARYGIARTAREGIVYVTEDRKRDGLFGPLRVLPNVSAAVLSRVSRFGLLHFRAERALAGPPLARMRLKAGSARLPVRALSGGNQQKVVFARALLQQPRLLICDEPTRGVDIGAKQEIHGLLREMAATGAGVLVVSSEFTELRALCDRIVVMVGGRLVRDLPVHAASEEALLLAASGIA